MKRVIVIALIIFCGISNYTCNAQDYKRVYDFEKAQAMLKKMQEESNFTNGLHIPCAEESYDNMDEMRGLGIAEGNTEEQARKYAIYEAVNQIVNKMPRRIACVTPSETPTETVIEYKMDNVQKDSLYAKSQIMCIQYELLPTGTYKAYVAVSVPKEKTTP